MSPLFDANPARSPLNEREWDKLINIALEGRMVPVIGPEALTVPCNGREELLYNLWGQSLAEQAGLNNDFENRPSPLYEVTNRLSLTHNSNDLAYDIDDIIRRRHWPLPATLQRIASITSIPLLITTTIDHLCGRALQYARSVQPPGWQDIIFAPRGVKSKIDLPEDFASSRTPAVFHMFGATSSVDGTFAKTEDDLIEFSWSLLDQQYAPRRLYDYLQKKTVVLLGCSFPDWLGRFFVHALNAGRQQEPINIYYVSSNCEPGLENYLRRKRAKVIAPQSCTEFIEELHRRWQARKDAVESAPAAETPNLPVARPFKSGAVFLSYASEDRATVRSIRAQLEAANIDSWMDETGLEPGETFEHTIIDHIRAASFFIAVISDSLDRPGVQRRYLWKEWKWAEDAYLERRKDDRFLQPLVIDETPPGAAFVDPPFRDLHWTRVQDGRLPDEFIQFLSRGIRNYRRAQ